MFAEHFGFELIFLAAVALVVVGPKDLPILMRKVGQFTAKMRGLAAEFRASFEELARQSELDELRKEVEALRQGQLGMAEHQVEIEREFDQLHHDLHPPPGSETYASSSFGEDALDEEEQPDLPFGGAADGRSPAYETRAVDREPEQPPLFDAPPPTVGVAEAGRAPERVVA